jgi:hypothetical protein
VTKSAVRGTVDAYRKIKTAIETNMDEEEERMAGVYNLFVAAFHNRSFSTQIHLYFMPSTHSCDENAQGCWQ